MDLLSFNTMQRIAKNAPFNEFFSERPLFCYHSGAPSSGAGAVFDYFGAHAKRPQKTFVRGQNVDGQPPSISNGNMLESAAYAYWGGNSSTYSSSSGYNPTNGYVGLASHSHSMLMNNMEISYDGVHNYQSQDGNCANTHASLGVVLGEDEDYAQGIDLLKYGTNILIGWTGDPYLASRSVENGFAWTALVGLSRLPSGAAAGIGDIAYNRKTNTLVFIENTSSTVYGNRLHIFKNLPEKLRPDAAHLKGMLEAAIAGTAGASYETFDFTWPGVNNNEWQHGTRIVPCDDDTFWLARMYPSSKLEIARVYFSEGTTRAFAIRDALGLTTAYGRDQNNYYGIRHMISDNQKVVAVYCPYYYYFCGGNFFFLPRDSAAVETRYRKYQYANSSYGMSIAPYGDSDFVLGWSSNADNKTRDGQLILIDDMPFDGSTVPVSGFNALMISGINGSTNYGGNGFIRVQERLLDTTEWNEKA